MTKVINKVSNFKEFIFMYSYYYYNIINLIYYNMSNKLAIIGGSGLYDVEEFTNRELIDLNALGKTF